MARGIMLRQRYKSIGMNPVRFTYTVRDKKIRLILNPSLEIISVLRGYTHIYHIRCPAATTPLPLVSIIIIIDAG